jgi:hypothetical protein
MPILNYTTKITPDRTVAEIQRRLAAFGVSRMVTEYGSDRIACSISFVAETQFGPRPFRLPANIDGVELVLKKQFQRGKITRKLACREQAARVAWRILFDWIKSQLAIIEAGLVTLDQAMLPYLLGNDDRTFYEVMVAQRLALSAPRKDP